MSIARCAALSLALLAAAGCGPDDGVLRVSFGLFPSENLDLPPAEQLGVELEAVDLAGAEGRCAADVEARAMLCELAGLPTVSTSLSSPHYRLVLHFDDEPIPPPTTSPPLALSLTSEVEDLGRIAPDPLGTVRVTLADTDLPLDHLLGGSVDIVIPGDAGAGPYRVLEGVAGNLEDEAAPEPDTGGGGHHH
ncbi:MAG TPA: hypothetical protein VKZ63_21670 [Kofleriaceae bacterium]|nr:hypothetical protein [Kofleriaceae bacterium]